MRELIFIICTTCMIVFLLNLSDTAPETKLKSPIGKALIGKDCKDMVTVKTPSGERNLEILKVDYI